MIAEAPLVEHSEGQAWEVPNVTPERFPSMVSDWLAHLPNAVPKLSWYVLQLCHLRPTATHPNPRKWDPRSTHELAVYALNPNMPDPISLDRFSLHLIAPALLRGQLSRGTDAAAVALVHAALEALTRGELKPAAWNKPAWDRLFGEQGEGVQ